MTKSISEILAQLSAKRDREHREKLGLPESYCNCCGAPRNRDGSILHDPECIWTEKDENS
jgi:hypothetical protein